MLTPLDWDAAARYLDLPERSSTTATAHHREAPQQRSVHELANRVKRIANQHAERELIDYKQRRVLLADWEGIDSDSWQLLQPRPGRTTAGWPTCRHGCPRERVAVVPADQRRRTRRADPDADQRASDQEEFIREDLPDLHDRLLILGELLIATPADGRDTLPARLEATLRERGYPIVRPDTRNRQPRLGLHDRPKPPRVPPDVSGYVLAHVAAHTGVDIPTLTTTFGGTHTPPAVIHARLLAAALLNRIWPTSWNAIGEAINRNGVDVADEQRRYHAARNRQPRLAGELEQLQRTIENHPTPAPSAPTTPHQQRMRGVAEQIQARAIELLAASHGTPIARRASIAACRQHTDLTCPTIAAIHDIADAQPAYCRATVGRYRHDDPDFDQRYQQLLDDAEQARRTAGFANANLTRALTPKLPDIQVLQLEHDPGGALAARVPSGAAATMPG